MLLHMGVVAVAAPLLALGAMGSRLDPVTHWPRVCSAVTASIVELVTVWAWHTPQLHHAARHELGALLLEQASFLGAGLFLWFSALGGSADMRRARSVSGVIGLWLTSMHMTLLGALIALSQRPLYKHAHGTNSHGMSDVSALVDQQVGGAIMLFVGALSYLAGGVGLIAYTLFRHSTKSVEP
jgi:putative membrane protein